MAGLLIASTLPLICNRMRRLTPGAKKIETGRTGRRNRMVADIKAIAAIISNIACSGLSTVLLTGPAAQT